MAKIDPQDFECVLYEVTDHVATITLNRPERRNALNRRAYDEVEAAFRAVSADPDEWHPGELFPPGRLYRHEPAHGTRLGGAVL